MDLGGIGHGYDIRTLSTFMQFVMNQNILKKRIMRNKKMLNIRVTEKYSIMPGKLTNLRKRKTCHGFLENGHNDCIYL